MGSRSIGLTALFFACLIGASAQAGITTFSGQDDGASPSGPFPNSNAAASSLVSAAGAFGAVYTETFDSLPLGTGANGGTFSIPGASVTTVTPFGEPYGGVWSDVSSGVYGFPISSPNLSGV
jgi:hypothetical protein